VLRPVLRQSWRDVAFLHWPLDPALAAPLLPAGTRPDEVDGVTYVGIIPLRVHRVGVPAIPSLPGLAPFGEVNVRLYSVDIRGRRGVVFLRMDADRLPAVLAARATLGLPYRWSRTVVQREGDRQEVTVTDRSGQRRLHLVLRIGEPHEPRQLEHFLTDRWGLHTRVGPRTVYLPLAHEPWPLHVAEPLEITGTLLTAAGLPELVGPPVSALYSPGVADVRFGLPSGV
jgi:uncharacterized protein YqjF (DUF2071 family)